MTKKREVRLEVWKEEGKTSKTGSKSHTAGARHLGTVVTLVDGINKHHDQGMSQYVKF